MFRNEPSLPAGIEFFEDGKAPPCSPFASQPPAAVFTLDAGGCVTGWSAEAEVVFGYPAGEMVGRSFAGLYPPEAAAGLPDLHLRRAAADGSYREEDSLIRKNGTRFCAGVTLTTLRDQEGRALGFAAWAQDLSTRRELHHALAGARQLAEQRLAELQAVLDNMRDGVVVADAQGELLYWNPAALQLHEFGALKEVRRHLSCFRETFSLSRPDGVSFPLSEWPMARVLRGETVTNQELVCRRLDTGSEWIISYTGTPIRDEAGQIRLALLTLHDVTAERRAAVASQHTADLLRSVAQETTDAIYVKDREGRYLFLNPSAAHFTGRPEDEVRGRDDTVLFAASEARAVMENDRRVIASGAVEAGEQSLTLNGVSRTYLTLKAPHRDVQGNVIGVIGISRDISERKRMEDALRESEARLRVVTETVGVGLVVVDEQHRYRYANQAYTRIFNLNCADLVGRRIADVLAPVYETQIRPRLEAAFHGKTVTYELTLPDGMHGMDGSGERRYAVTYEPHRDGAETVVVVVVLDITERVQLEERYRQSQKLEAIGMLAGGVAHDFNNMLSVINGYSELMLEISPPDGPAHNAFQEIWKAGNRAAALTRQLLAFSRKQVLETRVVDLNQLLAELDSMLRRLIGEDIRLDTRLATEPCRVLIDPGQMEQVVLNLAVNARDAMPYGGSLSLETRRVSHNPVPGGPAAPFILLSVRDTGIGMAGEVRTRIFEPFFTTKGVGKGTGLGLATVLGIIQQSGGQIEVDSEVGEGTCFRIYLPETAPALPSCGETRKPGLSRGAETVLLVEDEQAVRSLARQVMEGCGYRVLEAANGEEALALVEPLPEPVHLLVTDVVMPGMGGRILAERMQTRYPELKVLYISGYIDDAIMRHGVSQAAVSFLPKPFTPDLLAQKIRCVLDGTDTAGAPPWPG